MTDPRRTIVAGSKGLAPIVAPVFSDPPERDGMKKILNKRKRNRPIPSAFFGEDIFMASYLKR